MRWVRLGGLRFPSTFASLEILMMKTVMTLCVLSTVLSAALSFAAGDPPPDTTRVVIRGVDRVVDGWVRTDGTASFSEPTLSGHGRAWSAYDHILMRFDLSSVDAMRFARVRKAVLRLHVLQAKNHDRSLYILLILKQILTKHIFVFATCKSGNRGLLKTLRRSTVKVVA